MSGCKTTIDDIVAGSAPAQPAPDPCARAQRVIICEPTPPAPITINGVDCAGDSLPVTGLPNQIVQTVPAPGSVQTVKLCDPVANLRIEFSETLMYSASTEQALWHVREYNEDLGLWSHRYENLDRTLFTGTLPTDLTAQTAQVNVTRTSTLGCAAGVPYIMRETARFDAETGALESELVDWVDSAGVVSATAPAGFVLGACPAAQKLVLNSVHWAGPAANPTVTYSAFSFDNYPDISVDFPSTTSVADFYLHGIGHGPTQVWDTNGQAFTNPTTPVLWANAQPAVDAFLAAAGLPAGSVLIGDDGAGQPIIWFDVAFVSNGDIAWWAGSSTPDNYTNKLDANTPQSFTAPSASVSCVEGKAWYSDITGELVKVTTLDGVVVTVDPTTLKEGACPAIIPERKVLIYLERSSGVVTMADIESAVGTNKIQSVTVKQISGTGSVNGDAGSGVPLWAGETWSWSAITSSDAWDFLGASALSLDAGGGEQRITATYTP